MESLGPGEQQPPAAQEQDVSDTKVLQEFPGRRVERRPGNLVVKQGRRVIAAERENLAYARTLNLPVPRLRDPPDSEVTGADTSSDTVSIWMDYVDGVELEAVWPGMTVEQKVDVALQLRDILTIMRQQTSPLGSKIASCGGGEVRERRTWSCPSGGPFDDEACFNEFQLDKNPLDSEEGRQLVQELQQQQLSKKHRVVFTHGDLTQHNIIVNKGNYRIQALIDWEFGGWFPEYWEYVKFMDMVPLRRDWKEYARYIFAQEYLDELAMSKAIKRWQHS